MVDKAFKKQNGSPVKKETVIKGFMYSLHITWELSKVIVPAFIIVTLLRHTFVFGLLADSGEPLMKLIGLPGEAAMPLVIGMFFNQYLAIGALTALSLSVKEITIVALMLSICHELPVESAVVKKTGTPVSIFVMTRFTVALIGAVLLNNLWTVG